MFIIFGGLPGVGKTTLSRELARRLGATYLRIDTIEHAMSSCRDDAGYRIGYAVAEDNLRIGQVVVADSVNPLGITRDAWRAVAERTGVAFVEVELVCSDACEHRRRVEGRDADIAGFRLPNWQQVIDRNYEPWPREHVRIDTAKCSVEDCLQRIQAALVR